MISIAAEREPRSPGPILVATDFSADAERALARAALLAKTSGRSLVLLAVVHREALLPSWLGESVPELASEDRLERLVERRLAEAAARHALPPSTRLVVRFGKPWESILAEAKREGATLLVLGARGERASLAGVGSTAWRVLQGADSPLLIVRRFVQGRYRRVLVALDFDQAAAAVLSAVLDVAEEAKILVLHALGRPGLSLLSHGGASLDPLATEPAALLAEARSRLEALVREHGAGGSLEIRVCAADPVEAAKRLIEEGCELIAFGAPRRHPWIGALLGSFALAQLAEGTTDMLIVTTKQAEPG